MSCSFDFNDESCPIKIHSKWRIHEGMITDHIRPISDHTRGGKIFILFSSIFLNFFILLFICRKRWKVSCYCWHYESIE